MTAASAPARPAGGVPLSGFGVRGFRSFGAETMQYVGPLTGVDLFAGPNDAGKSNLLRAVAGSIAALRDGRPMAFDAPLDQPAGSDLGEDRRPQVAVHVPLDENRALQAGITGGVLTWPDLVELLSGASFTGNGANAARESVWFEFSVGVDGEDRPTEPTARQADDLDQAAQRLSPGLTLGRVAVELDRGRPGPEREAAEVLAALHERLAVLSGLPSIASVDAQRQLSPTLATQIRDLLLPGHDLTGKRERFGHISQFVSDVLDQPAFALEPTSDGTDIVAAFGEEPKRPAASFGAGLTQLIVIAIHVTDPGVEMVLLEEPEVHMHPTMQRRLADRLRDLADAHKQPAPRQFLIATHSAHLLSAERVSITAVARRGAWSVTTPAARPDNVARLVHDLGFRASDLVQTNFVVWVEGPSDRLYLRQWLHAADPKLLEGVHFSIVSYGGSLLRYLSPNDDVTPELVALPHLNRRFAVVIDSDRTSADQPLDAAKQRFLEAFAAAGGDGHLWVTQGYTIENYVQPDLLRSAVADVHDGVRLDWDGELAVDPMSADRVGRRSPAKVRVAAAVCSTGDQTWRAETDVGDHIRAICVRIRAANGLAALSEQPSRPS